MLETIGKSMIGKSKFEKINIKIDDKKMKNNRAKGWILLYTSSRKVTKRRGITANKILGKMNDQENGKISDAKIQIKMMIFTKPPKRGMKPS